MYNTTWLNVCPKLSSLKIKGEKHKILGDTNQLVSLDFQSHIHSQIDYL